MPSATMENREQSFKKSLENFNLAATTRDWDHALILLLSFHWPAHFSGLSLEIHYQRFFHFFSLLNVPVNESRVQYTSCCVADQSEPKYLRSEFDP